ncbi:MAG: phosphate ABC transporter substrate-binding protein [Alphaproteobacteria bacterium]|nr:phosphate ABC transporter substrate-binding protein [Alphaproteobacteria bacterium]
MAFEKTAAVLAAGAILATAGARAEALDPALAIYRPEPGIAGTVKSIGSDSLNNLMALWAEGFGRLHPGLRVEIEGKGSSTAPPALIAGTAHFGPMSRPMKGAELDLFEKRYGYRPATMRVAVDALALFVHKDNPLACLTLGQVDALFSKTRRGGAARAIARWSDLGLGGDFAAKPVSLYGRNSASGTYGYFKETALAGGDFKDSVKEQPGSSTVVQAVASDRYAIGYSGVGYRTADVRIVPLAARAGEPCFEPTPQTAYEGDYPLARLLYVYFNLVPNRPLDPARAAFVAYVYSRQGQEAVLKDGYYPITAEVAAEDLAAFGIRREP